LTEFQSVVFYFRVPKPCFIIKETQKEFIIVKTLFITAIVSIMTISTASYSEEKVFYEGRGVSSTDTWSKEKAHDLARKNLLIKAGATMHIKVSSTIEKNKTGDRMLTTTSSGIFRLSGIKFKGELVESMTTTPIRLDEDRKGYETVIKLSIPKTTYKNISAYIENLSDVYFHGNASESGQPKNEWNLENQACSKAIISASSNRGLFSKESFNDKTVLRSHNTFSVVERKISKSKIDKNGIKVTCSVVIKD